MNETHDCPICSEKVAHRERFPKQVCERCQSRTSDAYGRRLSFSNDDVSGGLRAVYLDSGEEYARRLCYIDGTKCFASEHRTGGVIVETVKD
jgi:hypothetical protein